MQSPISFLEDSKEYVRDISFDGPKKILNYFPSLTGKLEQEFGFTKKSPKFQKIASEVSVAYIEFLRQNQP